MNGCVLEFIVSSWSKVSRVIVVSAGVLVFWALVFLWSQAEGLTKGPNAACPPGRVIGAPTPVISLSIPPPLPPTPTPTNRNLTSPLNTPRYAPTAIVFSLAKTIDLDPTLAYEQKTKVVVCKRDGSYLAFLAPRLWAIVDLRLENGDVIFLIDPQRSFPKVDVPTYVAPTPAK
jgi:hypothetical protein